MIEQAQIEDAPVLTELTFRSKAYWGYSAVQMDFWREELSITPKYMEANHVFKLTEKSEILGYYSHFPIENQGVKLDNLFIEPRHIKKGFGKQLLFDFLERMETLGVQNITLDADPHATTFYRRFGFKIIGQKPSAIPDRYLPVMEIKINSLIDR